MITSIRDTVTLNNGLKIPQHGFGVYLITDEQTAYDAIHKALAVGYRSFDTAQFYKNEKLLGKILSGSGVNRSELFITTKVDNANQGYDRTLKSVEQSLKDLQLDTIDLLLIHWPLKKYFFETWKAMVRLYNEKLVRAIGVSNYEIHHLEELRGKSEIVPAVNQVESHPYLTQEPLRTYLNAHNIAFEAWSPLGRGAALHETAIAAIAKKYGRSIAQIIIRWHLQKGSIVIPKSITLARIEENANVYDFDLADGDIAQIDAVNQNRRTGPVPDEVYEGKFILK
jgi:diketogulonate reductase-like aldo/keto reductase